MLYVQCFTGKPDLPAKSEKDKYTTRRQKIHQKINISGGAINDDSGEPSSHDNFPAKQAAGCKSTPCKTSQRPLTSTERARILERVPFESKNPFFKILMYPTYVGSGAEHLVSFSIYNLLLLQTASLFFGRS